MNEPQADPDQKAALAALAEAFESTTGDDDAEWLRALVMAALEENDGDLADAVEMAVEAMKEEGHPEKMGERHTLGGMDDSSDHTGIDEPIHSGAGVDKIGRRYGMAAGRHVSLKGRFSEDEPDHSHLPPEIAHWAKQGYTPHQDEDTGEWHVGDQPPDLGDDDPYAPETFAEGDPEPEPRPRPLVLPPSAVAPKAPLDSATLPPAPAASPWTQEATRTGGSRWKHESGRVSYGPHEPGTEADKAFRKQQKASKDEQRKREDLENLEKPAKTTLKKGYGGTSEEEAREVLDHFTGGNHHASHELIGALGGSDVHVSTSTRRDGGYNVSFDAKHPAVDGQSRTLLIDPDGTAVCVNNSFFLPKRHQQGGLGTQVLSNQVKAMADAGVDSIETCAGRGGGMNGYYTWPLMGYDAELEDGWTKRLVNKSSATRMRSVMQKEAIRKQGMTKDEAAKKAKEGHFDEEAKRRLALVSGAKPKSVLDVMATPEGKSVWSALGYMGAMSLDLTPGSRSIQTLNRYLVSKGKPPIQIDEQAAKEAKQRRKAEAPQLGEKMKGAAERAGKQDQKYARSREIDSRLGRMRSHTPEELRLIQDHASQVRNRWESSGLPMRDNGRPDADPDGVTKLNAIADVRERWSSSEDPHVRAKAHDPLAVHKAANEQTYWDAIQQRHQQRFESDEGESVSREMWNVAEDNGVDPAELKYEARQYWAANTDPDAVKGLTNAYQSALHHLQRLLARQQGGESGVAEHAEDQVSVRAARPQRFDEDEVKPLPVRPKPARVEAVPAQPRPERPSGVAEPSSRELLEDKLERATTTPLHPAYHANLRGMLHGKSAPELRSLARQMGYQLNRNLPDSDLIDELVAQAAGEQPYDPSGTTEDSPDETSDELDVVSVIPEEGDYDAPVEKLSIAGGAHDEPRIPRGVTINGGNLPTDRIAKTFGREIDPHLLASCANAPDGASVDLHKGSGGVVTLMNGDGVSAKRTFKRLPSGELEVHNDSFMIAAGGPHDGNGLGIFLNQVRSLRKAGVDRIMTDAGGDFDAANSPNGLNGYVTWPKFGYDGNMGDRTFDGLPDFYKKKMGEARNVQALLSIPGGEEAWELYGDWVSDMKFDLKQGSDCMKRLDAYLQKRQAREAAGGTSNRASRKQEAGGHTQLKAKRRAELEGKIEAAMKEASQAKKPWWQPWR